MRQVVIFLQNAAHPDVAGRHEVGAADLLADQVLRLPDAGIGVDEHEAVAEAPVHEHRDSSEFVPLVDGDEIGADVFFADVELGLAGEPPMPLARTHVREEDQLDAGALDQPFLERAHDVVVAAGDGQLKLGHSCSSRSANPVHSRESGYPAFAAPGSPLSRGRTDERAFRVASSSIVKSSLSTTPYRSRAASRDTSSSLTSARTSSGLRSNGSPQPPPPPVRTIAEASGGTGMCAPTIILKSFSPGR